MKERELRLYAKCSICNKTIGHTGLPLFWKVTVERFGIDMKKILRQDGLAALLGSASFAQVFGPDEDMTTPMMEKVTLSFCEGCCLRPITLAELAEIRGVFPATCAEESRQ